MIFLIIKSSGYLQFLPILAPPWYYQLLTDVQKDRKEQKTRKSMERGVEKENICALFFFTLHFCLFIDLFIQLFVCFTARFGIQGLAHTRKTCCNWDTILHYFSIPYFAPHFQSGMKRDYSGHRGWAGYRFIHLFPTQWLQITPCIHNEL